jgi:hypothetical protein
MWFIRSHFRSVALLGFLTLLGGAVRAEAGWMGFRNDTSGTLVLQEMGARPGRPQKIFANEIVRDNPADGAARKFAIYSADKPDKPLFTGVFPAPADNENVLYVIKSDGKGGLTIEPMKVPAVVPKMPVPPKSPTPPPKTPTPPVKPKK